MGRKRSKKKHKEGKKKERKEKRGGGEPQQLGAVVIKPTGPNGPKGNRRIEGRGIDGKERKRAQKRLSGARGAVLSGKSPKTGRKRGF